MRPGADSVGGVGVQVLSATGSLLGVDHHERHGRLHLQRAGPRLYYVRTNTSVPSGFINQLYNGVVCVTCTVTTSGGTLVPVTAGGATTGINFTLAPGAHISGTITTAVGGAAMSGMSVQFFNAAGVPIGAANSNAGGM